MIEKPTIKESVLLCIYDCVLFVIKIMPNWMISKVAKILCFCGRPFIERDIRILRDNLEQILHMPKGSAAAEAFEKQTFFNHICSALETLKFSSVPESLRVDGQEELAVMLESAKKSGTGCLFLTGHLGSWESISWYVSRMTAAKCYALARRSSCSALNRFLVKMRGRLGLEILMIDRPLILRDMVKTLKSGSYLGVVMDQRPSGGRSTTVDFLGRKTDFVSGPAIAALIVKAPVYATFLVRKGPMHYEMIANEVAPAGHGITDVKELTQLMADAIERVINLYPEQWTWHYNRWKDSPEINEDRRSISNNSPLVV
ncbi:MAG: lysophospholipid acyltransferase family protein [Verrucomicrobia bacterium]|nr:lysophospholipid acyltransferase family protein [Verrucomicrobiota bacterium]